MTPQLVHVYDLENLPEIGFMTLMFSVTGFDLWLSVLALGIVCNIYTALVIAVISGVTAGRWEMGKKG